MKHLYRTATAVAAWLLLLMLVACTDMPVAQFRTGKVSVSDYFELRGRISIRSENGSESAALRWQRTVQGERIQLLTPLGSQVAELSQVTGARAVLVKDGKEMLQDAETMAALTQATLGVPVDTAQIGRWIQGEGLIEAQPAQVTASDGTPWKITVERLRVVASYQYAGRITVQSGSKVIKLVIDEWQPIGSNGGNNDGSNP